MSETKCQVGWKHYVTNGEPQCLDPCGNAATHRAICTNGRELLIFQVCEPCARLALPLAYEVDTSQGMKKGDPLWLITPSLQRELAELRARNQKLEWMNREGITDEDIAETMPPKPEDAR